MTQRGDSRNLIHIHLYAAEHVECVVAERLAFLDRHRRPRRRNASDKSASPQNVRDSVNHLGTGKIATQWLSAGTAGETYQVDNVVTTDAARKYERSFRVRVVARR